MSTINATHLANRAELSTALTPAELTHLTLYRQRYTLEAAGFTAYEAARIMFLALDDGSTGDVLMSATLGDMLEIAEALRLLADDADTTIQEFNRGYRDFWQYQHDRIGD